MQQLGVVPRLFPLILSGDKTSTIRWRESRIVPGYLRYVCDGDAASTAIVWVTRCSDMPLSQAAAFVGREAEWPKQVMLDGMREHYPDIGWNDMVQIIEHLTPAETRRREDFPG
ncbi:ASCH domain-containing protein [Aminobacter ciceronei]|uniref:ASCH domain-containing protein n=1 Tax=Aminobacter ciceronei TaxID=150723 RepID=A0ABR6C7Z2_9HYPH|nr:ASCH domain-containing protein [Aminobacter ciceronei]MBA8907195.1 hypothetical protein [Aminobacter ciceronei]MBA9021026.1 hypothetical protein [Aminobacter ciceronei]